MNAEEKAKQVSESEPVKNRLNDLEILTPRKFESFSLGDQDQDQEVREYRIFPPKLKQMGLVDRLEEMTSGKVEKYDGNLLGEIEDIFSDLLNEPDKKYIRETVGSAEIMGLLMATAKATKLGLQSLGLKIVAEKKTLNGSPTPT